MVNHVQLMSTIDNYNLQYSTMVKKCQHNSRIFNHGQTYSNTVNHSHPWLAILTHSRAW